MPLRLLAALLCSVLLTAGDAAAVRTREVAGVTVPELRMPVYVMEFHLWYDAPIGSDGRPGWFHGGASELADTDSMGPDWMRMRYGVGWPLPGSYQSGDPGILRWQLQCLKATGVDGVFIQLYAGWNQPETFHRLTEFERLLRIAEEVGVKVAIHDEVQFRPARAKDAATFAKRAGETVKRFATSPAYLRIDGKPAYAFQWWGQLKSGDYPGMPHDELQRLFDASDRICGEPAFWMPFRHAGDARLLALPGYGGGVVMSNSNNQFRSVAADPAKRGKRFAGAAGWNDEALPAPMVDAEIAILRAARQANPGKQLGLWAYLGFNNTTQRSADDHAEWLPRRGGRTLAEALAAFQDYGCDFVMISSWNDWEENTAIEPGFMYDGYAGDPYLSCRIVAAAKGLDFVPPPLPPKESVDPLMWQRLYGIDRTPPHLTRLRHLPLEAAIVAEVVDSASAVAGAAVLAHGDLWAGADGGDGLTVLGGVTAADGAFVIAPGGELTFAIDRSRLDGDTWWIGIESDDVARGRLRLRYPAQRTIANDRPGDEPSVRMEGTVSLPGRGAWRADTRLLRLVDAGKDQPLILRWEGKEGPLRVARVHLFRAAGGDAGASGLEISGAADASQVKTFRLPATGLRRTPVPHAAWLLLHDAAGNRSHPIGVARQGDGVGNRP